MLILALLSGCFALSACGETFIRCAGGKYYFTKNLAKQRFHLKIAHNENNHFFGRIILKLLIIRFFDGEIRFDTVNIFRYFC